MAYSLPGWWHRVRADRRTHDQSLGVGKVYTVRDIAHQVNGGTGNAQPQD